MKICELCTMCEHEEKTNCIFRPYIAIEKYEIRGLDIPIHSKVWRCPDFKYKKELSQPRVYIF